jgi:hypothetical protein
VGETTVTFSLTGSVQGFASVTRAVGRVSTLATRGETPTSATKFFEVPSATSISVLVVRSPLLAVRV